MTKDEVLEKLRSYLAAAETEYKSTYSPVEGHRYSSVMDAYKTAIALVEKLNQGVPPTV